MTRWRVGSPDDGASAVEFALVVPLLLVLVFGIIDYGIFFGDSLSVRQGVREGARLGVVEQCASLQCISDRTKERIDPIGGGDEYVRVVVNGGWTRGSDLTVCAAVKVDGVTGLTPMPSSGTTQAKVTMRIEQDNPPTPSGSSFSSGSPPGGWEFCA